LSLCHTQRNTKLESNHRGTPRNLFFSKGIQVRRALRANFILNLMSMLNRVTLCIKFILNLIRMLNRVTLRVNCILTLIHMLNRETLRVYFILNLNGMLNRVISCIDSFNYDWYAEFGMIMLDILFLLI